MTSHLTDRRADLAAVLADVPARVYTYVPEMLSAPAVIIQPGDPYIDTDEAATFCELAVHYLVTVVVDVATNETMTDQLDGLIGDVIVATAGAYSLDNVGGPFAFTYNTAQYLAANLTVSDYITFKE